MASLPERIEPAWPFHSPGTASAVTEDFEATEQEVEFVFASGELVFTVAGATSKELEEQEGRLEVVPLRVEAPHSIEPQTTRELEGGRPIVYVAFTADASPFEEYTGEFSRWVKLWTSQSPFDQLSDLRELQLRGIVSDIRSHLNVSFSEQLADRVEELVDIVKEEDPTQLELISSESLLNLIVFLRSEPGISCPLLFLTPDGYFRARWRKASDQHFAVEFLPLGRVEYVLFAQDLKREKQIARHSGVVSRESLMESVGSYKVRHWICAH